MGSDRIGQWHCEQQEWRGLRSFQIRFEAVSVRYRFDLVLKCNLALSRTTTRIVYSIQLLSHSRRTFVMFIPRQEFQAKKKSLCFSFLTALTSCFSIKKKIPFTVATEVTIPPFLLLLHQHPRLQYPFSLCVCVFYPHNLPQQSPFSTVLVPACSEIKSCGT